MSNLHLASLQFSVMQIESRRCFLITHIVYSVFLNKLEEIGEGNIRCAVSLSINQLPLQSRCLVTLGTFIILQSCRMDVRLAKAHSHSEVSALDFWHIQGQHLIVVCGFSVEAVALARSCPACSARPLLG